MIGVIMFGVAGGIVFGISLMTLNGSYKKWYLGPKIFPPQAIVYAGIPFGIAGIGLSISALVSRPFGLETMGWIVGCGIVPLMVLGFILALWRPRWIKPKWVNWLEDNYSDHLDSLIADASQNPRAWEKQVATQEGLEAWAKSVAGDPKPKMKT